MNDIDEDAMLTAIGQMSMDEAREKWADQWADFCMKLSNWKSIHQLFRLSTLANTIEKLTGKMESMASAKIRVNEYGAAMKRIEADLKFKRSAAKKFEEDLDKHRIQLESDGFYIGGTKMSYSDMRKQEIKLYIENEADIIQNRQKMIVNRKLSKALGDQIAKDRIEAMKLRDQYDITKPYAMGLLVADVFYSLSAALEGDIY